MGQISTDFCYDSHFYQYVHSYSRKDQQIVQSQFRFVNGSFYLGRMIFRILTDSL